MKKGRKIVENVAFTWGFHTVHIGVLILLVAQLQSGIDSVLLLLAPCSLLLSHEGHVKHFCLPCFYVCQEEDLVGTEVTVHVIQLAWNVLSMARYLCTLHVEADFFRWRQFYHHWLMYLVSCPIVSDCHLHGLHLRHRSDGEQL